ncbi:MAG: Asp-tRNA(Asn)/Glu-tRNA(Gln) amidotransferase subunit GatB [Chloroflexi bacterium]|nr:Asp-tRNA(Asn)/Glu-tRNA(Gln) amidotransferase subunit GatB [Chloroflexota bacterium]
MDYEVVIGLEVHSQLLTRSKMFCGCASSYQDAAPNTMVCEVCMGMPGVLPTINRRAVEIVIATGLALDCTVSQFTKFDRKNYPYPDLMKGYQISQFDQPIAQDGRLTVEVDGAESTIRINRVHLEEDVAKLSHHTGFGGERYSLLDINRAGVPLMETVSEPDMRSPEEARAYLLSLHSILRYIGASTANMEEGSFRCDANISVRPFGATELGPKVEVKNMNSFRSVFGALTYEADRQTRLARRGERIVQETRGWVEEKEVTVSQRVKEGSSDYRYFPEPDLPPMVIEQSWVDRVRSHLPELPRARMARLMQQYGLSAYDAGLLTAEKATADYFDSVIAVRSVEGDALAKLAKSTSNWMLGELTRLMKENDTDIEDIRVEPARLVELIDMVDEGKLSSNLAKEVFVQMYETGRSPAEIAEEAGLVQVSDVDQVASAVDAAIAGNPQAVADYMDGKNKAIGFLVGQVMKETRGKANPRMASSLVKEKLDELRQAVPS